MSNRRSFNQIISSTVVVLLLVGCGRTLATPTHAPPTPTSTPIPPTPTPTLPPGPKAGIWLGSVSFGGWAYFEVTPNGRIRNFSMEIPLGANRCTITPDEEIVVEPDGTFIIGMVDSDGTLETNSISGKFDSATTMIGAYSSSWLCGNMISSSTAEGTWDAKWKEP